MSLKSKMEKDFYPRPPRGGRLPQSGRARRCCQNFYPRPPRGGRQLDEVDALVLQDFYPRPPRGGRRFALHAINSDSLFLSTPSARRATTRHKFKSFGRQISIHALREEGDEHDKLACFFDFHFYPRPPRGGRRSSRGAASSRKAFLSTPSARRATFCTICGIIISTFLSTPSARRATPYVPTVSARLTDFYPRPPRGGRPIAFAMRFTQQLFLSTPSARRATNHSPSAKVCHGNFYPRPPRGGRPGE